MTLFYFAVGGWLLLGFYAYVGYPAALALLALLRRRRPAPPDPEHLPFVSITVPVHNEEAEVDDLLENLLASEYPSERRQILVVSDASTDRTDALVERWLEKGVELVRTAHRKGKTAAEAEGARFLRGEIVVNTDASIRLHPAALRNLVARFADPTIGVASGRDISIARRGEHVNPGESTYVGYEMWVRSLETRVGGIVGASGCLYAIRSELHRTPLPDGYSRDFSSALIARTHGYRAVSVDDALCYVPRTESQSVEYARKVRTITRGLQTLLHHGHLLNPLRYGLFSWMLISHKLCRWAAAWVAGGVAALALVLGLTHSVASAAATALLLALGWAVWHWRSVAFHVPGCQAAAFLVAGNAAAVHALFRTVAGQRDPVWQPTRRTPLPSTTVEEV
jgi:cellulose synthase/poly-beta-1,6-N-acetylglucosamine synthase-like glycosyltransferase